MADVSGGRVRGRPRQGWTDGVKMAFSSRGITVEATRQFAKRSKEWRVLVYIQMIEFNAAIFAWTSVLSTLVDCHLKWGEMSLHDTVGGKL